MTNKSKRNVYFSIFFNLVFQSREAFSRSLFLTQSKEDPKKVVEIYGQDHERLGHTQYDWKSRSFLLFDENGTLNSSAIFKKESKKEKTLFIYEKDSYIGKIESEQEDYDLVFYDAQDQKIFEIKGDEKNKRSLIFVGANEDKGLTDSPHLEKKFNSNRRGENLSFSYHYAEDSRVDERMVIFLAAKYARKSAIDASKQRTKEIGKSLILPAGVAVVASALLYRFWSESQEVIPVSLEERYLSDQNRELIELNQTLNELKKEEKRIQSESDQKGQSHQKQTLDLQLKIARHSQDYKQLSEELKNNKELSQIHLNLFRDIDDQKRDAFLARKAQIEGKSLSETKQSYEDLKPTKEFTRLSYQNNLLKQDIKLISEKRKKAESHVKRIAWDKRNLKKNLDKEICGLKKDVANRDQTIREHSAEITTLTQTVALQTASIRAKSLELDKKRNDLTVLARKYKSLQAQFKLKLLEISKQTLNITNLNHTISTYVAALASANNLTYGNVTITYKDLIRMYNQLKIKSDQQNVDIANRDQTIQQHLNTIAAANNLKLGTVTITYKDMVNEYNKRVADIASRDQTISAHLRTIAASNNIKLGSVTITYKDLIDKYNDLNGKYHQGLADLAKLTADVSERDQTITDHLRTIAAANNLTWGDSTITYKDLVKEFNELSQRYKKLNDKYADLAGDLERIGTYSAIFAAAAGS